MTRLFWWIAHRWGRRHNDCVHDRWDCALFSRWLGQDAR